MNVSQGAATPDDDRVRREVGQRIRARREELGLTQGQLGARLRNTAGKPVPGTQVSKWERGRNFPVKRQWAPIADALHIGLDQLFAGLTEEQPEWSVALVRRVDALEGKLSALARLLGLEDAVVAVQRGPALSAEQQEAWSQAAEELAAQSGQSEAGDRESGNRAADG